MEVRKDAARRASDTAGHNGQSGAAAAPNGRVRFLSDVAQPATISDAHVTRRVLLRETSYRRMLAVADVVSAELALVIAVTVIGGAQLTLLGFLLFATVVLPNKVIGLYDRDEHLLHKTTLDELPSLFQVATVYTVLAALLQQFLVQAPGEGQAAIGEVQLLAIWVLLFGLTATNRAITRKIVAKGIAQVERCLLIGDLPSAEAVAKKLQKSSSVKAVLVGRLPIAYGNRRGEDRPDTNHSGDVPVLGDPDSLAQIVRDCEVDRVILAPGRADPDLMLDLIRTAKALGVRVSLLPRLFEVVGSSVELDELDGVTLLAIRRYGLTTSSRLVKRALDVVVAGVALILFLPFLALICLAIKLDSRGRVLFRQRRIGQGDREFEMLKFRTMVDGAEGRKAELAALNESEGLFKIADDPRITRVGGFLRRSSLDEFPQLVNVLLGHMSLVGPRPLVPEDDRRVEGWQRRRLQVTPGITGHWQLLGPARVPLQEMVTIDYLYGANWSLWNDVKIILRTVPHMLARRGL